MRSTGALEHEPATSDLPFMDEVKEKVGTFRSFVKTFRAVKSEEPPYSLSATERAQLGLMRSRKFNLLQTTVASAPALVVSQLLNLLFPSSSTVLAEDIAAWFNPFLIPILLWLLGRTAAWSSLKRTDRTPEKVYRAREAYYYLDGAYGLIPEALAALGYTIFTFFQAERVTEDSPLFWPLMSLAMICAIISGLWVRRVTNIKIPSELFKFNGYSPRVRHFWMFSRAINWGPWNMYHFLTLFVIPILFSVLSVAIVFFSEGLASVLITVRSWANPAG